MVVVTARHWWNRDDQFDWFSAYLKERGLQTQWRATTFIFTVALAAIPVVLIASPTGPDNPVTVAISILGSVCALAAGILWMWRWPTRRQSVAFATIATGVIAGTTLSQSSPYAALMGCTTFAMIGGFVGYFHTAANVALNFAVALACAVIGTWRLVADSGDIALAGSAFLLVVSLNVGVPFGIHSLAHTLRHDLRTSGHDPLTGLLNRRAFYHSAYELLMRHRSRADTHLIVVVIDLDNFKRLNDTQGHVSGDRALEAVGSALRETCRTTAVLGRLGGEEFVIADWSAAPIPDTLGEQLLSAIAATPFAITASIGSASAPLTNSSTTADPDEFIAGLLQDADSAMYEAKRAGGNRVCHHAEADPTPI